MPLLGLPLALVLGAVADLAAGVLGGMAGGARALVGIRRHGRRLSAGGRRDRPAAVEVGGAAASLLGAGLAAGAVIGVLPGSVVLVYLAMVGASVGGQVVTSAPPTERAEAEALAGRREAAIGEIAFLVALGAAAWRWGAVDLEAVRGTQTVLGPGLTVGPVSAAVGVVLSAVVILVSGSLRATPVPEASIGWPRPQPAGRAVLLVLVRWGLLGATSLLAGVLVAGADPATAGVARVALMMGAATVAAVLLGIADALRRRLPEGWPRRAVWVACPVGAAVAAALVVLA